MISWGLRHWLSVAITLGFVYLLFMVVFGPYALGLFVAFVVCLALSSAVF